MKNEEIIESQLILLESNQDIRTLKELIRNARERLSIIDTSDTDSINAEMIAIQALARGKDALATQLVEQAGLMTHA